MRLLRAAAVVSGSVLSGYGLITLGILGWGVVAGRRGVLEVGTVWGPIGIATVALGLLLRGWGRQPAE